jgi:hypothetical protein
MPLDDMIQPLAGPTQALHRALMRSVLPFLKKRLPAPLL